MFTICDLQLEPRRFHYITDLKFLPHARVTTLYSINLELNNNRCAVVCFTFIYYLLFWQQFSVSLFSIFSLFYIFRFDQLYW